MRSPLSFPRVLPTLCFFCILAISCPSVGATEQSPLSSDDMATLQSQMRANLLTDVDTAQVKHWAESLSPEGSWADVDYADRTRGGWKPYAHLTRLEAMAQAYEKNGSPLKGDAALREAMLRALDYWLEKDLRCPNWWYNEIGVPGALSRAVLLIQGELSDEQLEKSLAIIRRATFAQTGQNSVWRAGITFTRALIEEEPALAQKARDIILKDVIVTTAEGVQPDFSFHQHGPQQQFGNYGLSFASDMVRWGLIWRGTPLALSDEQMEVLRRYLIDGESWVVHNGVMDISACGRQLFPGQPRYKGEKLLAVMQRMAELDPENAELYASYQKNNWGDRLDRPAGETGNRMFWRSDYMIHRCDDWMVSIKTNSTRTIGCETCNSENMQGYYAADGVMFTYRTGDEYEDIFPVWDWHRLPGVTCRQQEGLAPPPNTRDRNKSDFVGGVSDGEFGIAVMDYDRNGVKAKKSWFCLGDSVICLGAGISSETDDEVVTSIEQRLADKGRSVFHAGDVDYHLYPPYYSKTQLSGNLQTGTWKSIRTPMSDEAVAEDIFSATAEHGVKPDNATYAYAVATDEYGIASAKVIIDIVSNAKTLQAVAYKSVGNNSVNRLWLGPVQLMAVFYTAGECKTDGVSVQVDEPCVLMLREKDGVKTLSVADPTQKLESLTVTVNGEPVTIKLPSGGMAGSTVTQVIE